MRQRHQLSTPTDVVQIAMDIGLGRECATMVVPFMWLTPGGTDSMSPPIIVLVRGIQGCMRDMGIPTRGDGLFDSATAIGLRQISGPQWKFKAWVQICGDVLTASSTGVRGRKNMSYSMSRQSAMGELTAGTDWSVVGGICRPTNSTALREIKGLQSNANRILKAKGKALIDVDGRVGPKTLAAVNYLVPMMGASFGHFSNCSEVTKWADDLNLTFEGYANTNRYPAVGAPPTSRPSTVTSTGKIYNPPQQAGFVQFLTTPVGLALVGGGVFLFLMSKDKKKKPAKRKPVRRRRRPRQRITRTYY